MAVTRRQPEFVTPLSLLFSTEPVCGVPRASAFILPTTTSKPANSRSVVPKDRLGYATNGSADALKDWLVALGGDPGPLFCNINKGGRITIRRLTDQAVWHILKKRAAQASVASFSPHDLRRSFVSDLLDAGADISTAQQLAGHANVQTTARYDRRGEATKRKAAELLHVPYLRRKANL